MTSRVEVRILGPLEVWAGDEELTLGGAKQRAVLSALLLRAGEVVPVHRLIDEVWGDDPPPSAPHTLESYISRLRQRLNGHGPQLSRRGAGYSIDLGEASFDAGTFCALQESAALAATTEDHESVVALASEALALWRGPALADVSLASAGRAEADRLEEVRLHTHELRFDAELALARHEQIVGALQALVAQNPYRERFVAQLMLALYRSGRHAESLEAYERMRRRLDEDLGLQPSAELQQLSGQIVRQDPGLRRQIPTASAPFAPRPTLRARRLAELVLVGAVVAAVMALTASGGAPAHDAALAAAEPFFHGARVALVVPRDPARAAAEDPLRTVSQSFRRSAAAWDYDVDTLVVAGGGASTASRDAVVRRIQDEEYALVAVLGADASWRSIAAALREQRSTRFVFLDAALADIGLDGIPNFTGMPFATNESSRLAGYLSGLVSPRGADATDRADVVAFVAGGRTSENERAVAGFERGLRQAAPRARLLVSYSRGASDRTACELLANRQIDRGADIVVTTEGPCGRGALAVARLRAVWGIAAGGPEIMGPQVLATTWKWWESASSHAVNAFALERLPRGKDIVLGLADEYAVGVEGNSELPEAVWRKVVELCGEIREHTHDDGL